MFRQDILMRFFFSPVFSEKIFFYCALLYFVSFLFQVFLFPFFLKQHPPLSFFLHLIFRFVSCFISLFLCVLFSRYYSCQFSINFFVTLAQTINYYFFFLRAEAFFRAIESGLGYSFSFLPPFNSINSSRH